MKILRPRHDLNAPAGSHARLVGDALLEAGYRSQPTVHPIPGVQLGAEGFLWSKGGTSVFVQMGDNTAVTSTRVVQWEQRGSQVASCDASQYLEMHKEAKQMGLEPSLPSRRQRIHGPELTQN